MRVDLQLTIVGCPAADTIERDVRVAAGSVPGVVTVDVDVSVMAPATRAALTERLRAGRPKGIQFTADSLTRVIAVTSGKGGVGKSTVTVNLAVALGMARGPHIGLITMENFHLGDSLQEYHLYHAARADLLRRAGENAQAREAYQRALELAQTRAERAFLARRIASLETL